MHTPRPDLAQYDALRRSARVTPPSTALTTALKQVGLATADKELVPYPNPVHLLPFISTGEMIMSWAIPFDVKFVPVGTGSAVWDDDPYVDQIIHRFMPHDRKRTELGVLHMGAARPTPGVLRDLVVTVGEDVKAGRYGNFSLFICSEDEDTRSVIGDIAASRNVALFVSSSSADLKDAEPVGVLTAKDRETLRLVSQAGGSRFEPRRAGQYRENGAGNRLVSLQKKGYLSVLSSRILPATSSSTLARCI